MYLRGDGGDPARPQFALSGPPPATWLERERIVAEEATTPPPPSTTAPPTTAKGPAGGLVAAPAPPTTAAPAPATSTTAAPSAASPTTSASAPATTVASAPAPTAAVRPAPTPTTAPTTTVVPVPLAPGQVTPAQRPFGSHNARGVASWFNAPDGTCAHTSIPVGTVVRVTRLANGAVTTCVVDQWGPADTTRIIDLSMDTFEKLASTDAGLIDVLIEW